MCYYPFAALSSNVQREETVNNCYYCNIELLRLAEVKREFRRDEKEGTKIKTKH
jgi:hypothetical protein